MALIVLTSPLTFAASSTDLTVTGLIIPNACTPTLSDGGLVDHGKLSAKDLNQDKRTQLPIETLQLAVNCDAPVAFRLLPTDNRFGKGEYHNAFHLSSINDNQRIGSFDVRPMTPMADGVAVKVISSTNDGGSWIDAADMGTNQLSAFAAIGGPLMPIAIKDLVTDLRISTDIARADSLDLTNDVTLDGSVTLEVFY